MEERQIGTTELRQRLTDVIQAAKEEKVAYVVETFGRLQVVLVDVSAYERLLTYRAQRESFFEQLLAAGEENDPLNCAPTKEQLLALNDESPAETYQDTYQ